MKFESLIFGLSGLLFSSLIIAISSCKGVYSHYYSDNLNISKKNNETNNKHGKISLESQDAKFEVLD